MDRGSFTRALWAAKLDRTITPNAYLIGRALLRRADRRGRCWPSLDTLAADVGCCARTAGSAVASLRLLGLLDWEERRANRFRRASNLYTLAFAQPQKDKRINLESSMAKIADGPIPEGLAAALARLQTSMNASTATITPSLAALGPAQLHDLARDLR